MNSPSQVTEERNGAIMMDFLSCLAFCIIGSINAIHPMPPTEPPLIQDRPFVVIWNAPINKCQQLQIPLDFAAFKAVSTPAAKPDQFVTMFYENRLGLYPKVDNDIHSGGIPQNGNLTGHLSEARSQIHYYISQKSSHGLAVIDWESWRPLWDQNWGSKRIYQNLSISHARQIAPRSSSNIISQLAKQQFQEAGRRFMEKTIRLGISQRPNRRWGFYLFPDCYNYGWEKPDYTGECSMKTKNQNDMMMWLWECSTVLFPSIYLPKSLMNSPKIKLFVRNRVQEALRVATLPKHPYTMPIYVFSRPLYRDQAERFESKMDLENTVGESAALGASGVIMWGATNDYNSEAACKSLSEYLTSTLNPYIANVTAAAMLCSEVLCQGKGRCIRKRYNSTHCLHLNPANFCIKQVDGKYVATGQHFAADLDAWAENFTCQCYAGWSCSPNLVRPAEIKTIWI